MRVIKLIGLYFVWIPLLTIEVVLDCLIAGLEWLAHKATRAEVQVEVKLLNVKHNRKGSFYSNIKRL
jgi:hypothetical protein